MHIIYLFQTPAEPLNNLIESGKQLTGTSDGYTFAVILLICVLVVLLFVIRHLWKALQLKNEKYELLVESSARLMTEVTLKLNNSDELRFELRELTHKIDNNKCDYQPNKNSNN